MTMKKVAFGLVALAAAGWAGCSSPSEVKKLETEEKKLEKPNPVGNENVGIKDEHFVVQRKEYLSENLRRLQNDVKELENLTYGPRPNDVGGLYLLLKDCRIRLSDKRLGGDGKYPVMEGIERFSSKEPEYKYGLDAKDQLVAISDEYFHERIKRFTKYKEVLEKQNKEFEEKLGVCESNYKNSLVDHGLDPEDTKAKGEWVDGPQGYRVWKMKKTPTYDVEELQKRKAERVGLKKSTTDTAQ